MRRPELVALMSVLAFAACTQNWDMLEPEESGAVADERAFTRLDGAPEPLTNEIAIERVQAIRGAVGAERVALTESFLQEFPEARRIGEVHRLAGEGHLTAGSAEAAAEAFERALVMTRTDLLGVPLEPALPLQLAMARLSAGHVDAGLEWLARTSVIDHSDRVLQSLRWAHSQYGVGELAAWLVGLRDAVLTRAPRFTLPGLDADRVGFDPAARRVTLINFWSPT